MDDETFPKAVIKRIKSMEFLMALLTVFCLTALFRLPGCKFPPYKPPDFTKTGVYMGTEYAGSGGWNSVTIVHWIDGSTTTLLHKFWALDMVKNRLYRLECIDGKLKTTDIMAKYEGKVDRNVKKLMLRM